MGVETVAVYSEADAEARYLQVADDAVCIGPAQATESYMNIPHIISAAEITNVDAIHPGYGFLAENANFAEICEESNIAFIGPSSDVMAKMGNKARARRLAEENKVPTVPGSEGVVETEEEALELAHDMGYPVMIKAAAGGGGRGMRIAHNDISLKNMFALAQNEANAAFDNPALYVEKYLEHPRHVEVQILADHHGNVLHLGERDCSIQRRYQKLIEETPCPGIDDSTRKKLHKAAVRLADAVGYTNAGTVEFLVNADGEFYFMEMNTRLQVEHPITEQVTGIDLVREQLRVSMGQELEYRQKKINFDGVSIECRITAENPHDDFRSCPGEITTYLEPGGRGVRVDTDAHSGHRVPPYYDSMVAKLIVHEKTRSQALRCLRRALAEYRIEGIDTSIPFFQDIIQHGGYINGEFDIKFVQEFMEP